MEEEKWFTNALAHADDGEWVEAIKCFEEVLKIAPDWIAAWETKAACYMNLHDDENCIPCFDAILKLDPGHVLSWGRKGISLGNLGRDEEGLTCLDKAIALYTPEMADHLPPGYEETLMSVRASTLSRLKTKK